jgi:hypothetical protein
LQRFLWQDLSHKLSEPKHGQKSTRNCSNLWQLSGLLRSMLQVAKQIVVMRRFLSEAEDDLTDLVENIRSSTQKIDEMCSNADATVPEDNKTPSPVVELSPSGKT